MSSDGKAICKQLCKGLYLRNISSRFKQRKTSYFHRRSCVCVTYFHGWKAAIVMPSASVRWTLAGICSHINYKKPHTSVCGLCLRYLFSRLESSYRHAVRKCPVDTCRHKKPPQECGGFVFALPIFMARKQLSSCRPQVSGGHLQA